MTAPCLVMGGSGFIGAHLVRRLAASGIPVRVFGNNAAEFRANLDNVAGVELLLADVADRSAVQAALDGVASVVYLIHTTVPGSSMADLAFDLQSNMLPLIGVLEAARASASLERFVYISSGGTVYGDPPLRNPIPEEHPTLPISSYGLTKLLGEHYVRMLLARTRLRSYLVRPSNAYGEGQNFGREQGVIGFFLRSLAMQTPVVLYGNGAVVRDFLYVADLADALALTLADRSLGPGDFLTLNVGSGAGVSLAELIRLIERLTGRRLAIEHRPARDFDCQYNVLNAARAREILGWRPQVTLEEGLLRTWRWILAQHNR